MGRSASASPSLVAATRKITAPSTAASTMATSTPTVACPASSGDVPKAKPMISSDTVNPIPDSADPPITLPMPTPLR